MTHKTQKRPTLFQSNLSTVVLITISLATLPFTLLVTLVALVFTRLTRTHLGHDYHKLSRGSLSKTVLVTGARATKALTLIRAFKREGHRVIVAEEERWGKLAMPRCSRGVDAYYLLPDPSVNEDDYIQELKYIIARERVDAWVPCSSVQATMVDSEAARQVRLDEIGGSHGCECFIPDPEVAGTLHWKDRFQELLFDLGISAPDGKIVERVSDAVDFLHSPETQAKGHTYLLKSLTLDDLGRDDLTLFPLNTRDETTDHLSRIPTPISQEDPFLLQQYLYGPEYCTHVAARDGKIVAFVACRSNPLLMRYADVANLDDEERTMGRKLEEWSQHFLDMYKAKLESEGKTGAEFRLTGHFSFDFIYEENERKLYVLECNVRAHTAVCLLSDNHTLGAHYLNDLDKWVTVGKSIARPPPGAPARSWLAHALPLTMARLVPRSWCAIIHPQLHSTIYPPPGPTDPTASPPPREAPISLLRRFLVNGTEQDGVWDWTDPMPFFVLCHITWPWLLVNRMRRGTRWSRVNVSTSRVFEC